MDYQKRIRTPTIIQMESTECGATVLSIILGYYQRYITAEEARTACGVSRDGSKLINILKAARNYGMDAYGANLDIDDLDQIAVPFIVYWEFNHFLVVEGFNQQKVFLNDPASGPRSVSWDEFDKGYTGIAVQMTPGEAFQKGGKPPPSLLRMLFWRLGKNQLPLVYLFLLTMALIIPKVSIPIFSKAFIDQVLINNQYELFKTIFVVLSFTSLASILLTWLQKRLLNRLQIKLEIVNTLHFIWHLLHVPMHYFQQRASGDIVERSNISEKIAKALSDEMITAGVSLLEMAIIILIVCFLSLPLGLSLLFFLSLNFIFLLITQKKLNNLSLSYSQNLGKLEAIQVNGIQQIESIKIAALEQHFFNRWISFYTKLVKTKADIMLIDQLGTTLPTLLGIVINVIMICLGAYLVIHGSITIGTIVAIQALILMLLVPFNSFIQFVNQLRQLKGDVVRLNDIIDTKVDSRFKEEEPLEQDLVIKNTGPILEVSNLVFGYSPLELPAIYNLSLQVAPSERVAIVGPSGGGKSTLAKLFCGLNKPWSGSITLNGLELERYSPQALSKFIAYVDQNILFIRGTLRDNLSLWDNSLSDEKMYEVLEQVNMYECIMARGGLGLMMTETGNMFSGGQKQCIEIARALLRSPKLLILDEATSALDPILEEKVYQRLKQSQSTIVVIAHRLSTITDSDRIFVIEEGELSQQGTHDSLMNQSGTYRTLMIREEM
ncbi:Lactococcin-G-processing and transport ATP-binding protein LagD [Legionella massiliensis]|uniref:Lactococcin-G-processing and transport ATP-binding protein LagD n=1 Tax=Legionella massiliensis TaxID=1034943 RepID=A0A078KSZ0_9GAMM|nr:cysteine peptidase family C39 domain-containing protein [Legionella massiliensis]CDZ77550.1 Lactococcin-G-processing and transport ATP-binding protein LagD [Legionella massiliensis]CEE13288.1 Lactococcin-G-processing and transport ATP-binding protein LagD [Legionella massiliensis]